MNNFGTKIFIATPIDYDNYGNRLQNFATHRVCEKLGFEPVTIGVENRYYFQIIPKHIILAIIEMFKAERLIGINKKYASIYKSFLAWKFTKRYIRTVYSGRMKINKKFNANYVGIGGDQIWSPYWHKIIPFCNFIDVDPRHKICFAPSFGTDTLPQDYLRIIKSELCTIENIAVREKSGQKIIAELLGKNAPVVADSVLLLDKHEWESFLNEDETQIPKNKYVLIDFLGGRGMDEVRWIQTELSKKKIEVIDVSKNEDMIGTVVSPIGFVKMIANAEWVMTDSFHCGLFSLIFGSNLVLFQRNSTKENMNTRLYNLSETYGLKNCWFRQNSSLDEYVYDKKYVLKTIKDNANYTFEYIQSILAENSSCGGN